MNHRMMSRVAAALWGTWGLVHLAAGLSVMRAFAHEVAGVPESVNLTVMGSELPFEVRRSLVEHQFNNSWFGLVVLVGSVLLWRGSRTGVLLCNIVGGLAHLGFTLFQVLPGASNAVGVGMTVVVLCAVVLSLAASVGSMRAGEPPPAARSAR